DAIAYSSYDELLDNVDGVVICTPNDSHVDYAIRALQKDVAVLLEKPISNSFDSAKQLMEVAKTAKAFNMIGYTNRFSNQVQALKKLVSEKMTRVFHVNITYGGQRCSNPLTAYEWRMSKAYSGNGALIDYGSHAFDLIRYICNVNIEKVSCHLETIINERKDSSGISHIVDNDDIANITAIGDRQTTCAIVCSRLGFNGCDMTILGDGGTIKANIKGDKIEYIEKKLDGGYTGKTETISQSPTAPFYTFASQASAFVDGMLNIENPTVCSLQNGYKIETILTACEKSNTLNQMIAISDIK
ncbi:MAG: Gfo/Idh/MocA family oxidoreductase, partial [Clostridia bacterium]